MPFIRPRWTGEHPWLSATPPVFRLFTLNLKPPSQDSLMMSVDKAHPELKKTLYNCFDRLMILHTLCLKPGLTDPPPSGITIRGKSWSESTAEGSYTNSERTPVAGRLRRLAWACEASVTGRNQKAEQSCSSGTRNTRVACQKNLAAPDV